MKRSALYGLFLTLLAWAAPAFAQPVNLPANSVWGRLGIGTGPGQAIPFANFLNATGAIAGPTSTTIGDMVMWNNTTGTLVGDAPLNWVPLGGASGNGSLNLTSAGGMAFTSPDLTTLGNSIQLGGSTRVGDTITLTLNYTSPVSTGSVARAVNISYGPVTGADTLTTIAAGLATVLQTAGLATPLKEDFAPFRFFIPGTVGNVGSLFKFNFLYPMVTSLSIVNNSTAGTPTTITINTVLTAVGGSGSPLLTFDQVPGISMLRNYGAAFPRAGLANDSLYYIIVGSNTSTPSIQAQYANISVAIGDPTAATPYGVIQLATGNAWSGQANVWIGKGMFISNFGNSLTPTYPGGVGNNRTAVVDPGTGSLTMQGWTIPGNAITGTWPANNAFGFWGNSNLTHTDATKVAIAQDTAGFTFVNSAAGQVLDLRIGNTLTSSLSYAGGAAATLFSLGISGTSVGQYCLANATSGSLCVQPGTGALGSNVLTLPVATDQIVARATTDTLTNKTYDTAGAGNVFKINGTGITAVTGTGSVALSASPTFTGTLGAAAINTSGTVTAASIFNANSAAGAYQINGVSVLSLSSGNILIQDSGGASAWVATTTDNFFDAGTSHFRTKAGTEYAAVTTASAAFANGTAIPAGGTAGTGIKLSSTANFGVFFGSGAPTLSAAKGSLYLRSDGAINARLYINTDGSTTWTAFNTASWLLWRDIDPAANDNGPAFLEKVA